MKNSKVFLFTAFAPIYLAGCSTAPVDPALLSIANNESAKYATIFVYKPTRNENFSIMDPLGCTKKWSGRYTRDYKSTPFGKHDETYYSVKVKGQRPITINYSWYMSDNRCTVSGTIYTTEQEKYLVYGRTSGGRCTIKITKKETGELVPFFQDPKADSGWTCKP